MKKIILGIETSCDETGLALVLAYGGLASPKFKILKNLVASQVKIHEPFGGVVPNLAKREHLKNLPILFGKIFGNFKYQKTNLKKIHDSPPKADPPPEERLRIQDVDLISVTVGPGLEPALWTGITFAKQIISNLQIPNSKLVGVNHLEGHLYSFLLPQKSKVQSVNSKAIFPAIALIVSGGHTILLLVKDLKTWKKLGETRDDAVGEAFDKVARLLKLPYPGGPALEKLARRGDSGAIDFPRPMIHDKNYDFSFSGLKTSVLYYLRDNKKYSPQDVAASFQAAAVDVLVKKTLRAVGEFSAKSVLLSGGVAANRKLRNDMKHEARKLGIQFLVAEQKYNTDNAVMIAAAGYMTYLRKKRYPLRANGNLSI
ncbi:MAG: tRNA N6-adenosine threonylcarbamoyltransferase [Parcubacteria group bacterium Gr01-1014_20]|nr:MAG: tRNA N6-adenosine threonylcarbamoyltransferase [Parcubacteria group bacterium Gr01-1014_20]